MNGTFYVVDKNVTLINVTVGNVEIEEMVNITIRTNNLNLTADNVTVLINGIKQVVTGSDGIFNVVISRALVAGNYTVSVSTVETEWYNAAVNGTNYTVFKHASELNVPTFSLNTIVRDHNVTIYVSANRVGNYILNSTNVTVSVDGMDYIVTLDASGRGNITLGLPVGNYTAVVSFGGNDKYNVSASVNAIFRVVDKDVTSINITVNDTEIENDVRIVIKTNNADLTSEDNITVRINGVEVDKSLIKFDIGNREFTVTVPKVIVAGNYTVTVNIPETDIFNANFSSKEYAVFKHASSINDPEFSLSVVVRGHDILITVEMGSDGRYIANSSSVMVTVNGTDYAVGIDKQGKGNLTLSNLVDIGEYNVTVYFAGNDYYYASNYTVSKIFKVIDKITAVIDISVNPTEIENDVVITIATNNTDLTSNEDITVRINGVDVDKDWIKFNKTSNVFNVTVPADGVAAGDYTMNVEISETEWYNKANASANYIVYKHAGKIADIIVPNGNVIVGHNATVKVIMGGYESGDVIIEINGTNYTASIKDKNACITVNTLPVGEIIVRAYYNGDYRYNATSNTDGVKFNIIGKNNATITFVNVVNTEIDGPLVFNVTYNGNSTLVVKVNDVIVDYNATIGGYIYSDTGVAGVYTITAWAEDNPWFYSAYNSTLFNVIKHNSTLNITNTADDITATVTRGATGTVTFIINGALYTVELDGCNATVYDVVFEGRNCVVATYSGDDKYESSTGEYQFGSKLIPEMDVDKISNARIYQIPVFDITVHYDVSPVRGNVTLRIDGEEYTVGLSKGKASIKWLTNLTKGNHVAEFTYNGNEYYDIVVKTVNFTVGNPNAEDLQKLIDDAIADGSEVLNLTDDYDFTECSPVNITDSIKINGNGHVIENATSGAFNITCNGAALDNITLFNVSGTGIISDGDNNNFTNLKLKDINGIGIDSTGNNTLIENIAADNVNPGPVIKTNGNGNEITNVVAGNSTGSVIDSEGNENKINNVKADNITGSVISNNGNNNNISNVNASGVSPGPVINTAGDNNLITNVSSDDVNGTVVTVNGDDNNIADVNATGGSGTVVDIASGNNNTVENIDASNHTGDIIADNGTDTHQSGISPGSADVIFDLSKTNTTPTVFDINLPADATGNFTVNIGGKEYSAPVVNGKASISVSNIMGNNILVSVKYSGDNKYSSVSKNTAISVPITPDAVFDLSKANNTPSVFNINLPADATGNFSVNIMGNDYTAAVVNGSASISVSGISGSDIPVIVSYSGDGKYPALFKIAKITVPDDILNIVDNKNMNIYYLEPAEYTVRILDSNSSPVGNVMVKFSVAGKSYNIETDANGYASLKINLKQGNYNIVASVNGVSVSNKIKVKHIIYAKKTTNVKKSAKRTVIDITVKGHKVKQSAKVNFTYKGKNTVKIKFGKDMKNQKVTVKFKGKTYKVKVNSKGVGKLKLSKKVAKKLKSGKKYQLKVTFIGPKLYKNVKLVVKFNGKKYKVKTNNMGVAKFKVTKNMVKKYKKGKKVKYTVSYKNDKITKYIKIK